PAAPTGPARSTGTHTVTWKAVTGATRYRVRESNDGGQSWTVFAYQDTLSRPFKDRKAGTWHYQVQACTDTDGQCSAWSASLSVTVTAPITLVIAPDPSPDGAYTVSWDAPAHTAIRLRLWQQVETGGTKAAWTVVGAYPAATTSKAFSQGAAPATYHYKAEYCITVRRAQTCWGESKPASVTVSRPVTPAAPTGLTHTTADARGNYTVSWTPVTGTTHYELQESDDDGKTWDNDYTINTGTGRAFSDKDPGTRTYQVRACHRAASPQCSDWSAAIDVTVPELPAPKNVTHTTPTTTGNYTVRWDAVTHATRYELRESDDGGKTWDATYPVAGGTNKAFTGKARGTRTYRVRACRVRAVTCGEWSDSIEVPVSTLTPPGNVTATTPDERGNYTLSWDAVTGATGYEVQESEDDKRTWSHDYTVNSGRQRAFTAKTPATRHYRVRACDADTCGGWSRPALPVTVPRLAPPENLTHTTPDADGDYTLSWDAVTHATRYELRESDDDGKTWDTTYAVTTGLSQAIAGKTPGAWTYQARACRAAAATCSEWSATLSVTVPGPPEQPDAPALTPGDTQLSVTWTAPADNGSALTGYNIRYRADTDTDWTGHPHTGTDTDATLTSLTNGTEYAVQVQAVNARGTSPWSKSATDTPAAFLTPPAGLTAPRISDGNHTVRWQPSPGATCYELAASSDGGQSWTTTNTGETTYYKEFSAVPAGTWTYRVRACAGMQVGSWSSTITVTVGQGSIPAPPTPNAPTATEVISQSAQTNSDKVGTLPGSFRVTEQGSASYRIDLALPPGSGGVTPPLALAYDSRRGNGLLGVGWALEGLSAITRCRQTLAQDGAARPLTFKNTDRFCLDGQRLVLSDGAANKNRKYGDPGTAYKTETDSFLIVTAKDGKAGHPDYFEVERKDGSTATYGARGAHASEHKLYKDSSDKTGHVLTWALQAVRDSVGNKITYHYTLDDKDGHRLTHIRYAYGNPGITTPAPTHKAEVALAYTTDRKDPTTGHLAGYPLRNVLRLDTVTLSAAPDNNGVPADTLTPLRRYTLRYDTSHTLSRLAGIKACTGANWGACLPETTFTWSDPKT
ncbi:MAG: fibronectin type III domain-containing protein, partial [Candidatus Dadabacteria bacterium]|nr:fibronectin type III domain-containing protein [Candidatus Dadabacteria bacterium]